MAMKLLLSAFIITILFSSCGANFIEDFLGWLFGFEPVQRSLSEAITSYLDSIFKKDDMDSEMLKELYMFYSDDDDAVFSSNFT